MAFIIHYFDTMSMFNNAKLDYISLCGTCKMHRFLAKQKKYELLNLLSQRQSTNIMKLSAINTHLHKSLQRASAGLKYVHLLNQQHGYNPLPGIRMMSINNRKCY